MITTSAPTVVTVTGGIVDRRKLPRALAAFLIESNLTVVRFPPEARRPQNAGPPGSAPRNRDTRDPLRLARTAMPLRSTQWRRDSRAIRLRSGPGGNNARDARSAERTALRAQRSALV